jgi:hypothetical protein
MRIIARSRSSSSNGIDLSLGDPNKDFGQGFYVTTVLHQAEQWANQKVRKLPTHVNDDAAVLTFDMDRDIAGGCGDHLAFVIADAAFYDFVLYNRLGGPSHHRTTTSYDIVYGPVAAFPQTITYEGCDQICFLTPKALAALGPPLANPSRGNPFFA